VSRRQLIGFVVVFALIGAGLAYRSHTSKSGPDLAGLRAAAALQPCPPGLGRDLPALRLPCLGGGNRVDLRHAGPGRPVLVSVWASWCGPCVREVPALVSFAKLVQGRVDVVGVTTEDPQDKSLRFAADYGMHYPSLVDDDGLVLRAFRPGPPVTLFLDASGHVTFKHSGELHSIAEIEQLVATHLGVTV
jgi:thiol-disulfide isomerase/thioredoxin